MLELAEASFRSLALGMDQDLDQDLDPGLVDLLRSLVLDTGGEYIEFKCFTVLLW